jgi:uncharacterized protein (DUF2132 family)
MTTQPYNPLHGLTLTFLRKTPWAREKVEDLYVNSNNNSLNKSLNIA